MSLGVGARLGHYNVTAKLGEGGMGEVWRATDTQLHRDVALKILPEAFATDPDRLARFQREAQVLASLNHPGIAAIYGIEEQDDTRALVLELVEGPTLADRIAQGPIPVDEALPIAKQIAEALEAAHEAGVIHRDLKPANIKVREDGTVKVLDFGLAKALDPSPTSDPSQSPTLTAAATQMGVIMGTAAYMSPEQARGKPVDKRADVWAFGAVLFEMLTGRRAFEGEDVSLTLSAVLQREPDWTLLSADVAPTLQVYLRRCVQKDPKQRVQAIGDMRLAMEGVFDASASAPSGQSAAPPLQVWQHPVAIVSLVVAAFLIGGLTLWTPIPAPTRPVTRFPLMLAEAFGTGAGRHLLTLSPDGRHLVYNLNLQLYVRAMDQLEATAIRGTEGAREPFFSPDGQWIGFHADSQLKRVSLSGGAPVALGDADNPYGASWGADDTIVFGQTDGIWRVPGTGGTPELVIPVEEGEQAHGPQLLPGGDHVLFTLRQTGTGSWDAAQIVVQSLASEERTVLIDGGRDARYLPTGHLVYALGGALLVQAFDLDELAMRGGPVSLVEGVQVAGGPTGAAQFSVSRDGTLVYVPGSSRAGDLRLVWVDHEGEEETLVVPRASYVRPRVSPEGLRVVAQIREGGTSAIWIADAARNTLSLVTSEGASDESPIWTPDGQHVVFASDRDGGWGFYQKSADGTGVVERLATIEDATDLRADSWSPDGNTLVFTLFRDATGGDIGVLSLDGEGSWAPLFETETLEVGPAISPDGQWIAYVSRETGRTEVYVQRFPDLGERRTISTDGGLDPLWSPDGRTLYYVVRRGGGVAAPAEMAVVTFDAGPPLSVGNPEVVFEHRYVRPLTGGRYHDLAPDGQRFLMVSAQPSGETAAAVQPQINVVLNWFEELTERVPVN